MHLDDVRTHCLSLPHATEGLPFGPDVLVFKVGGKVFALLALDAPFVSLKGDPEANAEACERYAGVTPAYHMNKVHWTSVALQRDVPGSEIRDRIDASYALVVAGLTRRVRAELAV